MISATLRVLYVNFTEFKAPICLMNFTGLTELSIHNNTGGKLLSADFADLVSLKNLVIDRDGGIMDSFLDRCPQLRFLTLGYPHLITPEAIARVPHLTYLCIRDSIIPRQHGRSQHIHWINDAQLNALTKLRALELTFNTSISSRGISNLTDLRSLDVLGSSALNDRALAYMSSLDSLSFSRDIFTDVGLEHVSGKLTSLMVARVSRISDQGLAKLTALRILQLSNEVNLTGEFLVALSSLVHLTVRGTLVQGNNLARAPPSLVSLSIHDPIIRRGLFAGRHLKQMTQLEHLELGEMCSSLAKGIGHLTNLNQLTITNIGQLNERTMMNLPANLESFSITCGVNAVLDDLPTDPITRLTNLTYLHLPYQHSLEAYHILPLRKLRTLVAGGTASYLVNFFRVVRPSLLILERHY